MSTNTQNSKPKKRRWYHNFLDAYKVTARTFKWIPWAMGGATIAILAVAIARGIIQGGLVFSIISGVLFSVLVSMVLLMVLVRPAMYRQIDGTTGAVYSVVSQLRGWVVSEEPAQANKEQDIVWRIIGRPGVILISEGPTSRVQALINTERKLITRVVTNIPIVVIQTGHDEGQVPLPKLPGKLRRLKKILTKEEVPAVSNRLNAIGSKSTPIPRGIDPNKARMNRRALRGK